MQKGLLIKNTQTFIMRTLLGVLSLIITAHQSSASSKPSWFPKISCEQKWSGENPYKYDFQKYILRKENQQGNFGYQNFIQDIQKRSSLNRKSCYKRWTILVYMAAKNDLSPYSFWDLLEMEADYPTERAKGFNRAGSTLTSDLLVDVQNEKSSDLRRLHIFQSQKAYDKNLTLQQVEEINFDSIQSPIAYWKENRSGTPEEQLFDFIQWGVKEYPSENYMVVVWGHGQGWGATGEILNINPSFEGRFGGLAFQDEDSEFLTTPALSRVLHKTQTDTFEDKDKIDIYASDACLMQMAEVAYELSPHTKYIVGSAQVQSYLGFPYRRIMYEINRGCYNERDKKSLYCGDNIGVQKTVPLSQPPTRLNRICGNNQSCYLAQMLPRISRQSFHNQLGLQGKASPESYNNMTMSTFNAQTLHQKLPILMTNFAESMVSFLKSLTPSQAQNMKNLILDSHSFLGSGREIGILLGQILINLRDYDSPEAQQLKVDTQAFKSWLDALVLSHAYGKNYINEQFHLLGARSVALWIPTSIEAYNERLPDFRKSKLFQDIKKDLDKKNLWEKWIETLLKPKKISL